LELNKIYNIDCLKGMEMIKDKSMDMILCDLPYGVTARNKWDSILPMDELFKQYDRIIKDNGVIALTSQGLFSANLIKAYEKNFKYDLIWEKDKPTGSLNAKRMPLRAHEQILIFYKKLPTYNPQYTYGHEEQHSSYSYSSGNNYNEFERKVYNDKKTWRYPRSVLKINTVNNNGREKLPHPTQKPVTLFEWLIKTYTNEGETVLDNCIGSGTTAVACINTKRNFIGFELDKEYWNIATERIEKTVN
jgi:site-specific DNA-methyltransferase (adenine-specific)